MLAIMPFPTAVEEASGLQNVLDSFDYWGDVDYPPSGWAPTWIATRCICCNEVEDVAQLHDPRTYTDFDGWLHCCGCDIIWPVSA